MKTSIILLILSALSIGILSICAPSLQENKQSELFTSNPDNDTIKYTNGFDYPVGKPDGRGYYNAQKFTENDHLGDDWNGVKGGNSDLGDSIFAVANGFVNFASDLHGGWGKVIRITHYISPEKQVESLYAHCNEILIKPGHWVTKGDCIGTIGTANGQYLAHLHFEIRGETGLPIGYGYSKNTKGYLNPTKFIEANR